jgi:hypothetical protein
MQPLMIEWLKRILGYGAAAASGVVATKIGDPELAAWVGSGVAIVGGVLLNKAIPYVLPSKKKLDVITGNLRR